MHSPGQQDRFWQELRRAAYAQALRCGLSRDDAEDSAMAFVADRISDPGAGGAAPSAWDRRCAHNFSRNFRRALLRRQRREVSGSPQTGSGGDAAAGTEEIEAFSGCAPFDTADARVLSPERSLLCEEFHEILWAALERLPAASRSLFVRHYLFEESIRALSDSSGRSEAAVKQALLRARRQVRAALQRRGIEEDDLRAYG